MTFKKKKIGWINTYNEHDLPFSLRSESNIDIEKLINITHKNGCEENPELCPIFNYESLNPKIKFNHNRIFCKSKIFDIERKLLSKYGLPAYGVHCNVWSKTGKSILIHLAKRSKNLKKFPGMYDNLIAGGQPVDISIKDNLYKEAFEEAGLGSNQMCSMERSKTVHYIHNENKKLNSSVIFIYQLEKTEKMYFKNMDGEVEDFVSIEIDNLYQILEQKKLKPNCIIPIIDFFILKKSDFISKKAMLEITKLMKAYD